MDLNLYLGIPPLPPSQSQDLSADLTLSSVHFFSPRFAEEIQVSAPYSPSSSMYTPDLLPIDPLHAADPDSSSREPNDSSHTPELQSSVHGNQPLIRETSAHVQSPHLVPLRFVTQPLVRGVDAQIGYPLPPHPPSRISTETASLGAYRHSRDALPVQQELRENPEYRFQRLIELTNRLWGRSLTSSNDGQRLDSGAHSLTSPERLMHDIMQSQRALQASRKGAEGKKGEDLDKKNEDKSGSAAARFECSICYELAREPVVTPCGHLFCWPCLYRWLHAHSVHSECPVCKGQVLELNVTPIYGGAVEETKDHKQCGEDAESGLKIPPRPHANRIESSRRQLQTSVLETPEEGFTNSWRNNVDEEVHNEAWVEGFRSLRRQGRFSEALTLFRSILGTVQREEGSGSNSAGVGLQRDAASSRPLNSTAVFRDGVDLPPQAGSPAYSLNRHSPDPLRQHRHRAGPMTVADQASASSIVAEIHGDATAANPHAEPGAAGSSSSGRRRARNSALGSFDVDGVRHTRSRRLN